MAPSFASFVDQVLLEQQRAVLFRAIEVLDGHPSVSAKLWKDLTSAIRSTQVECRAGMVQRLSARHHELLNKHTKNEPAKPVSALAQVIAKSCVGLADALAKAPFRDVKQLQGTVEAIRAGLMTGNGNDCRCALERMLREIVLMIKQPQESVGATLYESTSFLKELLAPTGATLSRDKANLHKRLVWACDGISRIGNVYSYGMAMLSQPDQLEICACVSALAQLLPDIAMQKKGVEVPVDPPQQAETTRQEQGLEGSRVCEGPAPRHHASPPLRSPDASKFTRGLDIDFNSISLCWPKKKKKQVSPKSETSEATSIVSAASLDSPGGASSASAEPEQPPLPTTAPPESEVKPPLPSSPYPPTKATDHRQPERPPLPTTAPPESEVKPPLPSAPCLRTKATDHRQPKLLHDRPTELPPWPRLQGFMLHCMMEHMKQVPKAVLCRRINCPRDAGCSNSHSYMEVMRYNPLFKLMACGIPKHFWFTEAREDHYCVNRHLDLGISFDWMEQKQLRCEYGRGCTNGRCFQSHSLEEICWFNPKYKTTLCRYGAACSKPRDACVFYHSMHGSDADMRDTKSVSDFVGRPVPMVHLERTHQAYADALTAIE